MSRWVGRILPCVALLLVLVGCGGPSPVTTPPSSTLTPTEEARATVVEVVNRVDAHARPEEDWTAALEQMVLYLGGQVRALEASTARVATEAEMVRVAPNTTFTLQEPETGVRRLNLSEGQVWVNVEGLAPGEGFEVETAAAVAAVRGTRFSVRAQPDGTTLVSSQVATVTVAAGGATVEVGSGMQTTVVPGNPPDPPEPMSPDEAIRWGLAWGDDLHVALPVSEGTGLHHQSGSVYPYSVNWSSDGSHFSYYSYNSTAGQGDVFQYSVSTSTVQVVVLPSGPIHALFYNPTSPTVAYTAHTSSGGSRICTANEDGTDSHCWGGTGIHGWPFWSPDGQWILFYGSGDISSASRPAGWAARALGRSAPDDVVFNLYRARADGSELTRLTNDASGVNVRQAWSPDSQRIAYVRAPGYDQPGDVYVMNADGSDPRPLFQGAGPEHLTWSSDGALLAVSGGGGGLWLVNTDGSGAQVLSGTEGWICWVPVWSPMPNGWPLFFYAADPASGRSGVWYAANATSRPEYFADVDWGPVWSRDGRRAVFGGIAEKSETEETVLYILEMEPAFWP